MNNKIRYQRLPEDFYEIIKRRKLKPDECFLAIYLRGKSCRFGNPFKLYDAIIFDEINITWKVLSKLRKKLQEKGVIKYDTFHGRGKQPVYTMLDTFMVDTMKNPPKRESFIAQMGEFSKSNLSTKTLPNGRCNNKKEDKTGFVDTRPKNWREETLKTMRI